MNLDDIINSQYLTDLDTLEDLEHEQPERSLERYVLRKELYRKVNGEPYDHSL